MINIIKEVIMKVIDLTHTISEDMPVYPGTEKPKFTTMSTYEGWF